MRILRRNVVLMLTVLPAVLGLPAAPVRAQFVEDVVSFTPGTGAGFGQAELPDVVLGPPYGGGEFEGSLDVVSLGHGGEIVVRLGAGGACDGPGPDFTVFENAFRAGGSGASVFIEVGIVAVSADGVDFVTFPYDPLTFDGLAGRTPVLSHPDNGIDPRNPSVSGGDSFDLADIGLGHAQFLRITDPGDAIADPGNRIPPGNSAGFDLDAVAVVHACDLQASATPTATATATATATSTPGVVTPAATPTANTTFTATPSVTPAIDGDADGDGVLTSADVEHTVAELFDGDGDRAEAVAGGALWSGAGVDANRDGIVSAADIVGLVRALATR